MVEVETHNIVNLYTPWLNLRFRLAEARVHAYNILIMQKINRWPTSDAINHDDTIFYPTSADNWSHSSESSSCYQGMYA